jgi:glycosyltransferase involved in cell wall biosynthesis
MPKLLYIVAEDWFFVSHFLPMAKAARECGFEVVIATRVRGERKRLNAEGFRVIAVEVERGSLSAMRLLAEFTRVRRIVRAESADIVHCIALRSVVVGGLAAKLGGAKALVLAPTGLGHLWFERGLVARLLRVAVRVLVGSWLHGRRTRYLFENEDDPRALGLDPKDPDVTLVGGAGVDPAQFAASAEPPAPPVKVAVVARMIRPKGIAEAVEAVARARRLGSPVELSLFGRPDPSNPLSIPEETLRHWSVQPGITWHGHSADVAKVWRDHHVALFLSSYPEGLPRTLVEAAAAGRPIVTTDAPGCREVVRDGVEGLLVPTGDVEAAAQALVRLANDPALRASMGAAANARFYARFTEAAVKQTIKTLYRSLVHFSD